MPKPTCLRCGAPAVWTIERLDAFNTREGAQREACGEHVGVVLDEYRRDSYLDSDPRFIVDAAR